MRHGIVLNLLFASLLLGGCATQPQKPLETVDHIDLERYMGDWYVIAHIPVFFEADAYNAVESYHLDEEDGIQTTYTFLDGGFDEEMEIMQPVGTVKNAETNAEWDMQFVWPIQAEYLITHVDEDYRTTIVSRNRRDYVRIMARSPEIPDEKYKELTSIVERQGYDISKLRKVPQRWPAKQ